MGSKIIDINSEKQWLVVYTKPRWEKKVSKLLTNNNIENYCPVNKVLKQWSDRKKIVEVPLFISYVFVRAGRGEQLSIKQTDGILNFVYWLGNPAIIKNSEIDSLKSFLNDYKNVSIEKINVDVNDNVRVVQGPFMSMFGTVLEVRSKYVKLYLPSMGYSITAQVSKTDIEVINYNSSEFTIQQNSKVLYQ